MNKPGKQSRLFNTANHAFLLLLSVCMLLPFAIVIAGSLTDEKELMLKGVKLFPGAFSTYAYEYIFTQTSELPLSYGISIFVTAVGSFFSVLVTSGLAYAVSLRGLRLRNTISFYVGFTMLFHGGMIPWYMLCVRYLHLKNTILALILPMLVNPFYVFLMRTSFMQIPESLRESALIDSAGELRILFQIIIPVSLPIMATVALFYMLAYWNDFYHALFLVDNKKLIPLQYYLYRIISTANYLASATAEGAAGASHAVLPTESVRLATTVLTIGPIVFVYPFVQRYFVKGITIGAIKG